MPFVARGALVLPRRSSPASIAAAMFVLPLLFTAAGCGSGSSKLTGPAKTLPTTNAIGLSVSPAEVTLLGGASQSFSASVNNTTNQNVTWSVFEGSSGGSITTDGLYTAPTAAGTYHVIATSVADTSQAAEATVTVETTPTPTASVSVAISPLSISLSIGGTETFSTTVTNSTDTGVTYSIEEGSSGGSITAAGAYTAPSIAGTYHVVATSVADSTKTAVAAVTVLPTVTVSPATATVAINGSTSLSATVNGISDQTVTYAVGEGSIGGSVSSSGVYTAPNTAGAYHVIATSVADPSISGTATVTVQSGNSVLVVH